MYVVIGSESPRPGIKAQGVGHIAELQEEVLREAGHETRMAFPKNGHKSCNDTDLLLPSVRVPCTDDYFMAWPRRLSLGNYMELFNEFSQNRPDLFIFNSPHQVAGKLALIARILGIPYLLWVHTDLKKYAEARFPWAPDVASRIAHGLAKKIANGATQTIFPSKDARDKFVKRTRYSGKTLVLPGSTDLVKMMTRDEKDDFDFAFRASAGLPCDSSAYPILHMNCRLGPEKNVKFAIEAFAELVKLLCEDPDGSDLSIPGVESPVLVLVGGGTKAYVRELKELAKSLEILDLVYFAGERPHDEVLRINQISRCYLFPSESDTQGLAPLEAAVCHCPVMGMKGEVFEEFFGEDLAVAAQPFSWALELHRLLSNRSVWQEKSDFCYKAACKYSDKSHFGDQLLNVCAGCTS